MKIENNAVVKMHYSVLDKEGNLIDSSYNGEPLEFIQGSKYLIEGLENALLGLEPGATAEIDVAADDAYGPRIDGLVQQVGLEMFADFDVEVGMQLRATTDDGEQTVIVIEKTDEYVIVDGNHPLAGSDLKFDVEVLEVRPATADEIAHGHVHSEGGCGHTH
ncbi:MAG: peptidylprolyl isomerase [Gammaproteobacteria bacterium]|nr:peptidylprolyl isomerase [Gammaproteobacteria bacterium]